eukprot:s1077_g19.t1
MVAAGVQHTVLLRSDGNAVAIGHNEYGQCNIPALDEGIAYTQISAGYNHTVFLRSDGCAFAVGDNRNGQCNIPALDEGMAYTQISAGFHHTVFLRSDGCAFAVGDNRNGQCNIPPLDEGMAYTHVSGGGGHTVLLRSDGSAVAIGGNGYRQCNIPSLDEGMAYTQISAGFHHTVLLRSDGNAVAIGEGKYGQCDIPPLEEGTAYTQVFAGWGHTVFLRSDGSAVAKGFNAIGQCNIPLPEPGMYYVGDVTCAGDVALQLQAVVEDDDAVALICSTLVGEERLRLTVLGVDSAWDTHKRIARELNVNLPNLHLVLPNGQLLAKICHANPAALVAEDGSDVAIKAIDLSILIGKGDCPQDAGFDEEVQLLSKFRHPHLVTLLGWGQHGLHRYLVYEFLSGGDVFQRLHKSKRGQVSFPWHERLSVLLDAASGLSHMHNATPKAFHRDIKSAWAAWSPWNFSAAEVGIESFLGSHRGFEAKFQQFPYDFLVRELDREQRPIQFTEGCDLSKLLDFAQRLPPEENVWFTLVKREQTTPEALAKIARC